MEVLVYWGWGMKGIQLGVQGNPRRSVLAVLAIALAIAIGSSGLFLRGSLTTTISQVVDSLISADAYLKPVGSQPSDVLTKPKALQRFLDFQIVGELAGVPEVKNVYQVHVGPVVMSYPDGEPISSRNAPSLGISSDALGVTSSRLIAGDLPVSPTEIALEETSAKRLGLVVGDRANLTVNGNWVENGVKITGIVSYDVDLGDAIVVVLAPHVARHFFSPSTMVPLIAVQFQDAVTDRQAALESIRTTIGPLAQESTEVVLGKDLRPSTLASADHFFAPYSYLAWIIALLCVVVGALIFASIFAAAGRDKASEIAIMKSFGASRGQILNVAVRQALVMSALGVVVGGLLGAILSSVLRPMLRGVTGMKLGFAVPWGPLLIYMVAGILLATFTAWFSSRKSASQTSIEAIRGPIAPRSSIGLVRVILGVLLGVVGGIAVAYAMFSTHHPRLLVAGVAAHLLGIILMSPLLLVVLMPVVAAPLRLVSWVSARFAKKNARRSARRAGNIASVLIVGIAVATAGLLLSGSAQINGEEKLDRDISADFVVTSTTGYVTDSALNQVRQMPGSVKILKFGQAPARLVMNGRYASAAIYVGTPDAFSPPNETTIIQTTGTKNDRDISGFGEGVAVTDVCAQRLGIKLGDVLRFDIAAGTPLQTTLDLPVNLIVDSRFFGDILISELALYDSIPGHSRPQFLAPSTVLIRGGGMGEVHDAQSSLDRLRESDNATPEMIQDGELRLQTAKEEHVVAVQEVKIELDRATEEYPDLTIQTREEYLAMPDPELMAMRGLVFAFVGLCAVLAMITMAIMLSNSVRERSRETAVLIAGGATKGQLRRMVSFEALLIAGTSALAGVAFGVGLAFVVDRTLAGWSVNWTSWPVWSWVLGLFILTHIIGFIAGIPPALRAGTSTLTHEE